MLSQLPAFEAETPMQIIQAVLSQRLPTVSSIRMDIPDVIGRIIQKMTAKIIGDRYHSVSGLRHDLVEVRRLIGAGDSATLQNWKIATRDVSSFFILPAVMIGRTEEHDEVVKVIDKVSRRHIISQKTDVHGISTSGSSLSDARLEGFRAAIGDVASESDQSSSYEGRTNSLGTGAALPEHMSSLKSGSSHMRSAPGSQANSFDGQENLSRGSGSKPWEKSTAMSIGPMDSRSQVVTNSGGSGAQSSDGAGSLANSRNSGKFRRKGRCEVIGIAGAAGLGKSCLVQSVQIEARRRGYFASSKFDQAKKTPFGPVLKLLSSLFKQVFSEANSDTAFHHGLKAYVKPAWPMLHRVLGLPEFLLGSMNTPSRKHGSQLSQTYNRSLRAEMGHESSISTASSSAASAYSASLSPQSSQDFLRSGSSTKSVRLMNTFLDVLRVFTQHKFICFCLDDLQFADDESIDLIGQIVSSRMKMVIIVTYRPDEVLPERIKGILEPPGTEGISLRAYF